MLHITDEDEKNMLRAGQVADMFSLFHRPAFPGERKPHPIVNSGASAQQDVQCVRSDTKPNVFCKKVSHIIRNCPDRKCKVG